MKAIKEVAQKASTRLALGETTPIQIGLVIIILTGFFAAVWWASAINTKLDLLIQKVAQVEKYNEQIQDLRTELRVHMASDQRKSP